MIEKPDWIKEKGYLHLSPSLKIGEDWELYYKNITNEKYIAKYAFYPLIHTVLKDRKYKKGDSEVHRHKQDRRHCHFHKDTNKPEKTHKLRPLHYASHMDALVYGYYKEILNDLYEKKLKENPILDSCVNAYRKIRISEENEKGKSTIHFAKEAFDEIKKRGNEDEVCVLTFDLKSFFPSLNHQFLKQKWKWLLDVDELPKDHYNVFKACTKFRYVLLDDLRIQRKNNKGRRLGFDESKLAKIRKENGFKCFFENNQEFRKIIKEGKLRIYSNPFFSKDKKNIGIPQGLPISALLANIYLYDFDLKIVKYLVQELGAYYKRYSDDIVVICKSNQADYIENFIYNLIEESKVEVSKNKTEKFIFRNVRYSPKHDNERLACFKVNKITGEERETPLLYLGFEFRGYKTVIKSANLSRYYRKIISITKRRCKRAKILIDKNPEAKKAVYINQIKKLYNKPLKINDSESTELKKQSRKRYSLVKNDRGFFEFSHYNSNNKRESNYYSYVKRCCLIFGEDHFMNQIRKRKHVVFTAINRHLNKK
ncbi:reverse transcriptase/maturase family protein [Chryseobacterium profundimaris]|uniref:Reverse transcriptase (RNA-dependent DNA polymerase) n=1 Tax=Chryseobacterium profundimaris TaxID=1387275 RepID=A0ABY1NXM1_9FLAO|nr:reverse transcriptase/maturase family protein [Chryseobacterium profundimaris]SMP21312.1 Reverse transcriptase (RNA-dependent DNA polymerase) [Chryseobacterium profundimaris]